MAVHTLTQMQYSEDRKGPWKMYIYEPNSEYHRGGQWFRSKVQYEDEEIPTTEAFGRYLKAMAEQREIRVCDGGDMLVFHAKGGRVLYGEKFWEEIR